jgi:hypothetical protein
MSPAVSTPLAARMGPATSAARRFDAVLRIVTDYAMQAINWPSSIRSDEAGPSA